MHFSPENVIGHLSLNQSDLGLFNSDTASVYSTYSANPFQIGCNFCYRENQSQGDLQMNEEELYNSNNSPLSDISTLYSLGNLSKQQDTNDSIVVNRIEKLTLNGD